MTYEMFDFELGYRVAWHLAMAEVGLGFERYKPWPSN